MRLFLGVAAVALALGSGPLRADCLLLEGGLVHSGDAPAVRANVLVRDGRVEAVGAGVRAAECETLDLDGAIVTPGLVDAYSQIGVSEVNGVAETVDVALKDHDRGASFDPSLAFDPRSSLMAVARERGVTASLLAPRAAVDVFAGQAALVDHADSASVRQRGIGVIVELGESGGKLTGGSRAAALQRLAEGLEDTRYFERNRRAFGRGALHELALGRKDLEALLPVVNGEIPLGVRVNRASDIAEVLALAEREKIRVVVVGGVEAWKVADDLAAAGVPVILDALRNVPERFEQLGARLDNAARLNAAGVEIALTAFSGHYSRKITQLAGIAVANGLPWDAALTAITAAPARIWGIRDTGRIAPGMRADIVVWSGDPFEFRSHPTLVLVDGQPQPAGSRQTRLRDRYAKRHGLD